MRNLFAKIDHATKWSNIRSLQTVKIINSMYVWLLIVPVLATLMSKLPKSIILNVASTEIEIPLVLPFSWFIFYVGAIFFTFNSAIYNLFCPEIIREHSTYSDFASHQKTMQHLREYNSRLRKPIQITTGDPKNLDDHVKYTFWSLYLHCNELGKAARMVCGLLLLCGLSCGIYVFVQSFITVVKVFSYW